MINELITFVKIVEKRSFTKVAEELNLTQPAVSMHIKRLEEEFGVVVLQRSKKQKKIMVTDAGICLYENALQIIKLWQNTYADIGTFANRVRGTLHIGATFTIGEYFLPDFLGSFCKEYPDLDIQVTIDNTEEICKKANNYEVDIALVEGEVADSKLRSTAFYTDRLFPVVLKSSKIKTKKQLEKTNWIIREAGSGSRTEWERFIQDNKFICEKQLVLSSNFAVKEAVVNGLGAALLSEKIIKSFTSSEKVNVLRDVKFRERKFSWVIPQGIQASANTKVLLDSLPKFFGV